MRALRLTGLRSSSLEEVPDPIPEPDETIVQVRACALCRTDAKMWDKGQRDLVLPRILGHEIYGVDESTGGRCVVWPGESCGTCRACVEDAENLCPDMRVLGFNKDGGLAEKVAVSRDSLIPVPDGLAGFVATLAEPLGCCLNALNQVSMASDARVLIVGAGPVGLLMALAVRARGVQPELLEKDLAKLSLSSAFRERICAAGLSRACSERFDVTINATSSPDSLPPALEHLRPRGWFCFFSGFSAEAPLPMQHLNEVHYRQLRMAGAYGCTRANLKEALEILSVHQDTARLLIEQVISLEHVTEHMERIAAGQAMKLVVSIRDEA